MNHTMIWNGFGQNEEHIETSMQKKLETIELAERLNEQMYFSDKKELWDFMCLYEKCKKNKMDFGQLKSYEFLMVDRALRIEMQLCRERMQKMQQDIVD